MVRLALSYSSGDSSDLQFVAEGLPAGILVAAGDRVGKDRQGDRPEAAEAGEGLPLLRRGGPAVRCSIGFSVRMAARMSRALAFSPLAMSATVMGAVRAMLSIAWSPSPGVTGPAIGA